MWQAFREYIKSGLVLAFGSGCIGGVIASAWFRPEWRRMPFDPGLKAFVFFAVAGFLLGVILEFRRRHRPEPVWHNPPTIDDDGGPVDLTFEPEIAEVLRESGWNPERKVSPARFHRVLMAEGYKPSRASVEILRSFGGLSIKPWLAKDRLFRPEPVAFDPINAAAGEIDRFEDWEKVIGTSIFPLGTCFGYFILFVDANGTLYAGTKSELVVLGGNLNEAFSILLLARANPTKPTHSQGTTEDLDAG